MESIVTNVSYASIANPIVTNDWPPWTTSRLIDGRLSNGRLGNGRFANYCLSSRRIG
jgi:hypothetical protein